MRKSPFTPLITLFTLIMLAAMTAACYRGGRLEVRAVPPEAYVYVDGAPTAEGNASGFNNLILDNLSPGEHSVGLYNNGYKSEVHQVTIQEGKTAHLNVQMTRVGGQTSGPWGRIIMEGPPHAAVLLNGKTPDFLVGHVDEFDKDLGWRGQMIVPPGTHQVTVIQGSNTVWSGTVTVAANQTVDVSLKNGGKQTTADWAQGGKLSNLWPFRASLTKTTVVVAPVTEQFSASPAAIACGAAARLTWSSTGAVNGQISDLGDVPASGDREVQPKQTTTYKFTAAGPGGVKTSDATVTVNSAIEASLSVTPAEVRYHAIGDKVDQQGSATVSWSAQGSDTVSVDPFGSVGPSGERTVQATPSKTTPGPVDETLTYTLHATNACGGTETRTATLHIVGSIESAVHEPKFDIDSIYFPTAQPTRRDPQGGIVSVEQTQLNNLLNFFKQYLNFKPDAHLVLEGNADKRGGNRYNDRLSQRRADRVKSFLTEQNIPAGNIDTQALGKRHNLTMKEVLQLIDQNPNLTEQERHRLKRRVRIYWLANNRRVDIKVGPTGEASHQNFPYTSDDVKELLTGRRPGHHHARRSAKAKAAK